MANLVDYVKTVWENGKTALNAARMNNMEQGISNCASQINKLGDSVSHYSIRTANKVEFECQRDNKMERCVIRFYFNDTDFLAINFGYNVMSNSRDVCLYSSVAGKNLFTV